MTKIQKEIESNADNWFNDRLDNEEPLMLDEFYRFMRRLGYTSKEMAKINSPASRRRIARRFKKIKKEIHAEQKAAGWD